jgi:hypothetical protein
MKSMISCCLGRVRASTLSVASFLLLLILPWGSGAQKDDVKLYHHYAHQLLQGRALYSEVPVEYPPWAVPLFVVPGALTTTLWQFAVAFVLLMGAFEWLQRRAMGSVAQHPRSQLLWMTLGSSLLYYTYLKRFDVAAAALCTVALCRLVRRPGSRAAWAFLAAAIGCKLYPVVLLPLCLRYSAAQGVGRRRLLQQLGVAVGLGLLTLGLIYLVAGNSCLNWLLYHRDRGLHVASTYAAAAFATCGLGCHLKTGIHFGCFQIEAPWADRCAAWAPLVTLAALTLSYGRVLPALRRAEDLWRGAFALVVALLLASKVFSPQYMIWLLPLGAMAASAGAKVDRVLGTALVVCCALTAEMFPGETAMAGGNLLKQVCLVSRSLILLGLWGRVCWRPLQVAAPSWQAEEKLEAA